MEKTISESGFYLRRRCFLFGREILFLTEKLPNKRVGWIIGDQIARSATSIGANLFEAMGASSRREYKRYFEISLGSANETRFWLELLAEVRFIDQSYIDKLHAELTEIIRMIVSSVQKLKKPQTSNLKPQTSNLKPFT